MKKILLAIAVIGLSGFNLQAHALEKETTQSYADSQEFVSESLLTNGTRTIEITKENGLLALPQGKSYYRAFSLPKGQSELKISSTIDTSVFAPTIYLLDENHGVLDTFGPTTFTFKPGGMFSADALVGEFNLDTSGGVKYLVIATSDKQLNSTTEIEHPAKVLAKARSTQPPEIPNLEIRHSKTGKVKLTLARLQTEKTTTKSMLATSQQMYDQAINKAISSNNHELALQLMEEAIGNGSTTARATYLEALKQN